jgi:arylsulfatase
MGKLDDTLIVFIEGDNGASPEGGLSGTMDEIGHLANGLKEADAQLLGALEAMGGPRSYQVYPAGWAIAADTPFRLTKQVASHLGGTRNGLVISWPAKIRDFGGLRTQFHHVIDLMPTILELTGVPAPTVVDGVRQLSLDGISMAYTLNDARAPERRTTQYFEMLGYRGIYHDGWLASTAVRNPPWEADAPSTDPEHPVWELYDLSRDFSQAHDLARTYPDRTAALEKLWWSEAERNGVLPVNVERGMRRLDTLPLRSQMPAMVNARGTYEYWGAGIHVAQAAAPPLFARNFTLAADVVIPPQGAGGVIAAVGSWFGGWSFFLDQGRPVVQHSFSPYAADQFRVIAEGALRPGPQHIEYDFHYDGLGMGKGGQMRIRVNGQQVAAGRIERQVTVIAGIGETFDIGDDTGVPVLDYPQGLRRFSGEIVKVVVRPGGLKLSPF